MQSLLQESTASKSVSKREQELVAMEGRLYSTKWIGEEPVLVEPPGRPAGLSHDDVEFIIQRVRDKKAAGQPQKANGAAGTAKQQASTLPQDPRMAAAAPDGAEMATKKLKEQAPFNFSAPFKQAPGQKAAAAPKKPKQQAELKRPSASKPAPAKGTSAGMLHAVCLAEITQVH